MYALKTAQPREITNKWQTQSLYYGRRQRKKYKITKKQQKTAHFYFSLSLSLSFFFFLHFRQQMLQGANSGLRLLRLLNKVLLIPSFGNYYKLTVCHINWQLLPAATQNKTPKDIWRREIIGIFPPSSTAILVKLRRRNCASGVDRVTSLRHVSL